MGCLPDKHEKYVPWIYEAFHVAQLITSWCQFNEKRNICTPTVKTEPNDLGLWDEMDEDRK